MKTCSNKVLAMGMAGLGMAWALAATAAQADMTWSGWTQLRYNYFDQALDKSSEFQVRRARLKCAGPIDKQGDSMALQVDVAKLADRQADPDNPWSRRVVLKDAWVRHAFNADSAARMGLANIPWGIEVDKGDDWRLDLERSKVADAFFPDQKEVGLYYLFAPANGRRGTPEIALGYTNGQVDWGDRAANGDQDKRDHAFVGRARWSLPRGGEASLSYLTARRQRTVGGATSWYDQKCFTPAVRWCTSSHVNVMAEYYTGKILSVSNNGGYVQIDYTPGIGKLTPYFRYDQWDDGKAGHVTYRGDTLGVALDSTSNARYTLEWDRFRDHDGQTYNNLGLQWQFKYGGK